MLSSAPTRINWIYICIAILIYRNRALTVCDGIGSCSGDTIEDDVDCSGLGSCSEINIVGNAVCSGLGSCSYSTIHGNAECSSSSCWNSTIRGNANCISSSCVGAVILGDATCPSLGSCERAVIIGNAVCTGLGACDQAYIGGSADCSNSLGSCDDATVCECVPPTLQPPPITPSPVIEPPPVTTDTTSTTKRSTTTSTTWQKPSHAGDDKCCDAFNVYGGFDYPAKHGKTPYMETTGRGKNKCCKACVNDEACVAWKWNRNTRRCALFDVQFVRSNAARCADCVSAEKRTV